MLVGSFEEMQRWKEAGVTLLAYSSDADILYSGYAAAMKRIKGCNRPGRRFPQSRHHLFRQQPDAFLRFFVRQVAGGGR